MDNKTFILGVIGIVSVSLLIGGLGYSLHINELKKTNYKKEKQWKMLDLIQKKNG